MAITSPLGKARIPSPWRRSSFGCTRERLTSAVLARPSTWCRLLKRLQSRSSVADASLTRHTPESRRFRGLPHKSTRWECEPGGSGHHVTVGAHQRINQRAAHLSLGARTAGYQSLKSLFERAQGLDSFSHIGELALTQLAS